MNQIDIFYNPYRTLSRILIENLPVAEHSELAQYRKEPFHLWCDRIFDLIENELNDEYELTFTSTGLEREMLRVLGKQAKDCRNIRTQAPMVNIPLQKRYDALLKAQKTTEEFSVYVLTPGGKEHLLSSLTTGMTALGADAYTMSTPYQFCNIKVFTGGGHRAVGTPNSLTVLLSDNPADRKQTLPQGSNGGPLLFVCLNDNAPTGFRAKQGEMYCYSCEGAKLQTMLLRFLEFVCIAPDFQQKFSKLRNDPSFSSSAPLSLQALDSMDPVVRVSAPAMLEAGETKPLTIETFPPGAPCPELTYQNMTDGIVHCEGGTIEGLYAGQTEVTVYPKGSVEPCSRFAVAVIQRNRITSLAFDEAALTVAEDEIYPLSFSYLPQNADNAKDLQWESSDPRVAKVKDGRLKAIAQGTCTVTVRAEGVSASCKVTVKPVIKEITLSAEKIRVYIGQSEKLTYSFSPANVFDTAIAIQIDDPNIVQYKNGQLFPRCVGKTSITFTSAHGNAKAACQVEVDSSFRARPKGNGFLILAAILCALSFYKTDVLGACLAAGGILSVIVGFLKGKKTITLIMLILLFASLAALGYCVIAIIST